jgi:hypothetical protein
MLRLVRVLIACVAVVTPLGLEGQVRVRAVSDLQPPPEVPAEMVPPAGKCRIWMEGVAPAQQPAPLDCQTAIRQRPVNGIIVFGPSVKEPPVHGIRMQLVPSRRDSAAAVPTASLRRDSTVSTPASRKPNPPEPPF